MSDKATPTDGDAKSASAQLFDIRVLIGALFTVYGVKLIVAGFLTSDAQLRKASDINMNLWLGIGMLALGLLFLLWWKLNPLQVPSPEETDEAEPKHD
jgi:hypothetical protein